MGKQITPEQFIERWKDHKSNERQGAQAHFDDLCELLDVDKPRDPDNYCFERGAKKSGGSDGWADVWKRGYFGWENKKPKSDLQKALKQLTDYALNLDNPPLLVVCDREQIIIHTTFSGYPDEPKTIRIEELTDPAKRQMLKWVFTDPEKLRPEKSNSAITGEVAGHFANLAKSMRDRGLDGQRVAHFLVQCLFCMFAEDEELLPLNIFTDLLKNSLKDTDKATNRIPKLFAAMQKKSGGEYGDHNIAWFNGGLFKTIDVPELTVEDLAKLYAAALMDWRSIEPTIFGTLFERGLDPSSRAPLGAHYTDTGTIAKIITPLITEPLMAEWEAVKTVIAAGLDKGANSKVSKDTTTAYNGFLKRLNRFQVLDPACGSGNFLYLALKALRDVEKQVQVEGIDFGFEPGLFMETGVHNICGIETNEYAAELARVTVWIGDLQWCRRNYREIARDPILRKLDSIEHRDALINPDNSEAVWPKVDVIIGNPPFLGGSKMLRELGDAYVAQLRKLFEGRVPGGVDLVTYWFEKAQTQIKAKRAVAAGLVATNSIRGGASRKVLDRVTDTTRIFEAWSDEPWVNEGAAVRVSLVCFGDLKGTNLDGKPVTQIYADLTAQEIGAVGSDITTAKVISDNVGVSFQGSVKVGSFDITEDVARSWLKQPNPNGLPNSNVLRPLRNAKDLASRPRGIWIVDFSKLKQSEASFYELPFQHVLTYVKPFRASNNDKSRRENWWLHGRTGDDLRSAVSCLDRVIITPRVSKHRFFVWLHSRIYCDDATVTIARHDDTTFGILHSRFHELWSLRLGTSLEDRPRYTPTTCFETFPFPSGLTPNIPVADYAENSHAKAIAKAAFDLNKSRENWLNPVDWVDWIITPEEEKAGYPKRSVAKAGFEADLKKRTLTNLYNVRPAWLDNAHKALDKAVAAAYCWNDYTHEMTDETILGRLLEMNRERAKMEKGK